MRKTVIADTHPRHVATKPFILVHITVSDSKGNYVMMLM